MNGGETEPHFFIGRWKAGKIDGYGEMRFDNGDRCFGVWSEGKRVLYESQEEKRKRGELYVSTGEMRMREYEMKGHDAEFSSQVISRPL